jgi:hypothetical protein
LVVKEALIKAAGYNNKTDQHPSRSDIFAKTIGIIFMGTPHRGGLEEAKFSLRLGNDHFKLLQTLRVNSDTLEDQQKDFITISSGISVVCMREELPTRGRLVSCLLQSRAHLHLLIVPPQIVPRGSASFYGNNVCHESIHENHVDMVKFASNQDNGYQKILYHIKRLCGAGRATQQGV